MFLSLSYTTIQHMLWYTNVWTGPQSVLLLKAKGTRGKVSITLESHSLRDLMLINCTSLLGPYITASCSQRAINTMSLPRSHLRYLKHTTHNSPLCARHTWPLYAGPTFLHCRFNWSLYCRPTWSLPYQYHTILYHTTPLCLFINIHQ